MSQKPLFYLIFIHVFASVIIVFHTVFSEIMFFEDTFPTSFVVGVASKMSLRI